MNRDPEPLRPDELDHGRSVRARPLTHVEQDRLLTVLRLGDVLRQFRLAASLVRGVRDHLADLLAQERSAVRRAMRAPTRWGSS